MALVGYARVSTVGQSLDVQLQALAECSKIFQEKVSGAKDDRPQLALMLDFVREGDVVMVTKLDRLARNTRHLLEISEYLHAKRVALRILNLGIDTSTPTGKLMLTMIGAIATFERELMLERQAEGIAMAKQRGVYKGRKPTAMAKGEEVLSLAERGIAKAEIARRTGISLSSVQRETASAQVAGKWARYRNWLKQSVRLELPANSTEVNNNPYLRGGICSYNAYLSGMLRAHLWGLWLTALLVLAWQFLLPRMDLVINHDAGLWIIMGTVVVGTLHWAILVFIGYEKRLQAAALTDPLSRMICVAIVTITAAGVILGWYLSIERSAWFARFAEHSRINAEVYGRGFDVTAKTAEQLSSMGYDSWILAGQVMVYVGLALLFLIPSYRNSDNLAEETKEEIGKVQGYPTQILLLFHLLLLFPAVAILA